MKAEAWLVVEAKESRWQRHPHGHPRSGQYILEKVVPVRMTTNKPNNINARQIAFKIEIDVDEEWFLEPTPVIQVAMPAPPQDAAPAASVQHVTRGRAPSPAAAIVNAAANSG